MMKPISTTVAALLFGSLAPLSASAMTLEEALSSAYLGNPQLEAERAALRATDEQVPQALSGWRPQVSLTGGTGAARNENNNTGVMKTKTANPRSYGINVSQPLFRGFRTENQTNAAEKTVLAGRQQLSSVEQGVFLQTTEAYLNVVRDTAIVELNRNNEQVLQRQLDATRDRFQVGELTRTDVSQAESRLAGAVASRIAAEGQLNSSAATFERIVGLPPKALAVPKLPSQLPQSQASAIEEALTGQPDVLAAQYQAEGAQDTVKVAEGVLLPTVSLDASWKKSWDTNSNDYRAEVGQVMANVSVPLYQSGAEYSQIRESKHSAGRARILVDQARQKARESAIQAWDNWKTAQAKIDSFTSQVQAAQVALDGVQREAQVGSRTVLDVLDAEQELLNARVSLVGAQRDERLAAYSLTSAVGRLTASAQGLSVDVYDPTKHYEDVRGQWFGSSSDADADQARKEAEVNKAAPGKP